MAAKRAGKKLTKVARKSPVKKKKGAVKKAAPKKVVAKKKLAPKKAKPAPKAKKPVANRKSGSALSPTLSPAGRGREGVAEPLTFTEEIAAFCELVNSGGAGDADLEGYAAFNEQYKPSDWARNPAVDQQLLTFAMDGAGGQFSLWLQPGRALHDNPVVQLGDDGELNVLASDFPSFVALVGAGVNLFTRETGELTPLAQVQDFLRARWADRSFEAPAAILSTAQGSWPGFEDWLRAQVPN